MDYTWDSPGQNTGVGSHALLQGIFPTQGSTPGLLHCRRILYQLSYKGCMYFEINKAVFSVCSVAQLCPALCNPTDCSLPDSSVHGILQARILEWVAFLPPGDLPNVGSKPVSSVPPALAGEFFATEPLGMKSILEFQFQ